MKYAPKMLLIALVTTVATTTALASASAADTYNSEMNQMIQTTSSIQGNQTQLTAQITSARSSGNEVLASQLQAQYNQNQAVLGQMSGSTGVGSINIQSMDLETALMAVQQERTKLLDAQLKSQIQEVQNRNTEIARLNEELNKARSKGDKAAETKLQASIDALSNSQQMDMLRLQSLTNKRNEAFDVMTNFVKKMQETRSSIIGNMR